MLIFTDKQAVMGVFTAIVYIMGSWCVPAWAIVIKGMSVFIGQIIANSYENIMDTYSLKRWSVELPNYDQDTYGYISLAIVLLIFSGITLKLRFQALFDTIIFQMNN